MWNPLFKSDFKNVLVFKNLNSLSRESGTNHLILILNLWNYKHNTPTDMGFCVIFKYSSYQKIYLNRVAKDVGLYFHLPYLPSQCHA